MRIWNKFLKQVKTGIIWFFHRVKSWFICSHCWNTIMCPHKVNWTLQSFKQTHKFMFEWLKIIFPRWKPGQAVNLRGVWATPHGPGPRGRVSPRRWNSCQAGTFRRCTSSLEFGSTVSAARSLVGRTSLGSGGCHDHFADYESAECSSTHPGEALLQCLDSGNEIKATFVQ